MIEIPISDSMGNRLVLTTNVNHTFDAVTCSPRPDGFSVLDGLLGRSAPADHLQAACRESIRRNEVCILPKNIASEQRILLTPTLRSRASSTRLDASRLMKDLFNASQEVQAKRLLITHFAHIATYPEPHIQGICDALKELMSGSFLALQVLGFEVREQHLARFEHQLCDAFGVQPSSE